MDNHHFLCKNNNTCANIHCGYENNDLTRLTALFQPHVYKQTEKSTTATIYNHFPHVNCEISNFKHRYTGII